jgi:hypothetical protein
MGAYAEHAIEVVEQDVMLLEGQALSDPRLDVRD